MTASLPPLTTVDYPVHLAIGAFDGLHLGHRAVLDSAVQAASSDGGEAFLLTFYPHPLAVLRPELAPKRLMGNSLRQKLLAEWGLQGVVEIPFTKEFAAQTAEEFLAHLQQLCPTLASISVGQDWRFGKGRGGDVPMLREAGKQGGFEVFGLAPVLLDGEMVSSTRIRSAVESGDLATAAKLLGRPYSLAGKVVTGRKLARKLGFPTANVSLEAENLPPYGVYAVKVGDSPGVANLGLRPTVEAEGVAPSLEVHIFDFTGNLYGQTLDVELGKYLRPELRMSSLEELQAQIAKDSADARQALLGGQS